jgi:NADH-quinone oxidoreductase subunit J
MELIAFYGFSGLLLGAALCILFTRNLIYAAFYLFLALLGVAALYVLAGADFLAITQILLYVGGILVLLVFGIMLTQTTERTTDATRPNRIEVPHAARWWGCIVAGSFFGWMWIVLSKSFFMTNGSLITERTTFRTLGIELMTTHLLPFELAGILLLVALVGASYLATHRHPHP